MHRRSLLALAATALAPAILARPALAGPALAQPWPDKPIRLIVPVAAGGSQDLVARLTARYLTDALGQPVTVENQPGAGSNLGYEHAARARPDGHTLLAGSDSLSINPALFPRLSFDPMGFAPVIRTVLVPQILVVRADGPATLAEFVARGRRAPIAVGTPGNGSLAHLLLELLQEAADQSWVHAPYRGGALAVNDLLGGSLQGVMINIGAVTDHVRSGRLRGLAVSTPARSAGLPEVPTLAEAGFHGIEATGWHGLVAPPGTDPAICQRLNRAVVALARQPEVAQRFAALAVEPQDEAPEALGALIRADAARYAEVVRRRGLRPD